MATPKELPSSLMARDPLERIGSYVLSRTITSLRQGELMGLPTNVDTMQENLKMNTGVTLPDSLVSRFGFHNLHWQLAVNHNHEIPLTIFLWGTQKSSGSTDDAHATVEVARQTFTDHKNNPDIRPTFVRISGVDRQTNRIVAATYDSTDGKLLRVTFSLKPTEQQDVCGPYRSHERITLGEFKKDADPYENAGLITQAMPDNLQLTGKIYLVQVDCRKLAVLPNYQNFHIRRGLNSLDIEHWRVLEDGDTSIMKNRTSIPLTLSTHSAPPSPGGE